MGYLEEVCLQIDNQNFPGFIQLWQEYVKSDVIGGEEFYAILNTIAKSEAKGLFGAHVEEGVEAWEKISDAKWSDEVLKLMIDVQTSNSEQLCNLTINYLKNKYESDKFFKEKLRLVGLRRKKSFQGAIRSFELLNHLDVGKFVFHTGGWGAGEIVELSLIREQLSLEFENVLGVKDLSFKNAFSNLTPLENDNFLAKRFGNPDKLEEEAKKSPISIIRLLLTDLGPKTSAEIKEELVDLVIPAKDWVKWWQSARSKMKKDTLIQTPSSNRAPFILHKSEVSHEERFKKFLLQVDDSDTGKIIDKVHDVSRNFPQVLKNQEIRTFLREKLLKVLSLDVKQDTLLAQVYIFMEEFFNEHLDNALTKLIQQADDIEKLINGIAIVAHKKKLLSIVKRVREEWLSIFSHMFLSISQHFLRDFLLKELNKKDLQEGFQKTIQKLLDHPTVYPDAYVWYFQKIFSSKTLPFSDKEGKCLFFENLFVLLYHLEVDEEHRDLAKKIVSIISANRYALIRSVIEGTSIDYVREFLLLTTKCQSFNAHDIKIFTSLARVVHPSLSESKKEIEQENIENIIWATQEGYNKVQEKIKYIATVETVDCAKEIEAARALGDLRENSEYKFAQERRARLQADLKILSDQIKHARVLTKIDVDESEVGVGVFVDLKSSDNKKQRYLILGPWEADPDKSILSFQSQFAKAMIGVGKGEKFTFRDKEFTVQDIKSYFE